MATGVELNNSPGMAKGVAVDLQWSCVEKKKWHIQQGCDLWPLLKGTPELTADYGRVGPVLGQEHKPRIPMLMGVHNQDYQCICGSVILIPHRLAPPHAAPSPNSPRASVSNRTLFSVSVSRVSLLSVFQCLFLTDFVQHCNRATHRCSRLLSGQDRTEEDRTDSGGSGSGGSCAVTAEAISGEPRKQLSLKS